jgi:hypothetical protein
VELLENVICHKCQRLCLMLILLVGEIGSRMQL